MKVISRFGGELYNHSLVIQLSVFSQTEPKKSAMHQLLFFYTAGLMTFLAETSFEGVCRLYLNAKQGIYNLTAKHIINWMEVNEQLEKDFFLQ